MKQRVRIGFFPGSFNPPHLGHVELAQLAINEAGLDACFFYVNSFNREKRGQLIEISHRCEMLTFLCADDRLAVLDPLDYPDVPDRDTSAQEVVFLPLMARLAAGFDGPADIWLVRGSDNFRPVEAGGYRYPPELASIPHVIGIREFAHLTYDYSPLTTCQLVTSLPLSSTDVRARILVRQPVAPMVGPRSADYIDRHQLFGSDVFR